MSTGVVLVTPEKPSQPELPFIVTDINRNAPYTAVQAAPAKRLFDWFILSILGCLCFPFTGVCAVYYACRANHGTDWKLNDGLVKDHSRKAKILTIFSIVFGLVLIFAMIITTVLLINAASRYYYDYGYYNNYNNNNYNNNNYNRDSDYGFSGDDGQVVD